MRTGTGTGTLALALVAALVGVLRPAAVVGAAPIPIPTPTPTPTPTPAAPLPGPGEADAAAAPAADSSFLSWEDEAGKTISWDLAAEEGWIELEYQHMLQMAEFHRTRHLHAPTTAVLHPADEARYKRRVREADLYRREAVASAAAAATTAQAEWARPVVLGKNVEEGERHNNRRLERELDDIQGRAERRRASIAHVWHVEVQIDGRDPTKAELAYRKMDHHAQRQVSSARRNARIRHQGRRARLRRVQAQREARRAPKPLPRRQGPAMAPTTPLSSVASSRQMSLLPLQRQIGRAARAWRTWAVGAWHAWPLPGKGRDAAAATEREWLRPLDF
ncbi:MAG: hypothetical protein M1826_002868 [Phylliscum demangeonii]|nr:MAG: hypothetical protein M1826_002868 [Phylliscum demangeonii]